MIGLELSTFDLTDRCSQPIKATSPKLEVRGGFEPLIVLSCTLRSSANGGLDSPQSGIMLPTHGLIKICNSFINSHIPCGSMFSPRRRQLTRPFLVRAHILKNLQELKDSNPHRAVLEAAVFTQLN